MGSSLASAAQTIDRIDKLLTPISGTVGGNVKAGIDRFFAEGKAVVFHLRAWGKKGSAIVAVFGGTGTGKSTLVNRLVGQNISAASVKRTYTSGAIAIELGKAELADDWLDVEHIVASPTEYPVRGQAGKLLVAKASAAAETQAIGSGILVDTPDLDGDQLAHHAEADRVFRWAQAAVFVVTPEKYQMTELLGYYRLAARYRLASLFVMNKADGPAVVEDYARQLTDRLRSTTESTSAQSNAPTNFAGATTVPAIFVLPRDDSGFEPAQEQKLPALRSALAAITPPAGDEWERGLTLRLADLSGRLNDQVISPLRERRLVAERLAAALRQMETPGVGVDVNPIAQQLRQRLQQRSILYLMGPQRMLDRLRQAPGMLSRMPRVAWDYLRTGEISSASLLSPESGKSQEPPDFRALLSDQFAVVQSRIDDVLRGSPSARSWLEDPAESVSCQSELLLPTDAARIAEEEIADFRSWLDKRWDATPRDTKLLMTFLKYLPGGQKLTRWTEAAPYLLTIAVVTHHALFGHVDLLVLGGYSLATWLTEKLSNEVSSRTRTTNSRISDRFTRLVHEQIERTCRWLEARSLPHEKIEEIESLAQKLVPGE